jgi:hypothetical protein
LKAALADGVLVMGDGQRMNRVESLAQRIREMAAMAARYDAGVDLLVVMRGI